MLKYDQYPNFLLIGGVIPLKNADEWGAKAVYTATDRAKTIVVYDDTVFIYKFTADSEDIAAMRKALGR